MTVQAHRKSIGLNYDPPKASGLQGESTRKRGKKKKEKKEGGKLNVVYVQSMGMIFSGEKGNKLSSHCEKV